MSPSELLGIALQACKAGVDELKARKDKPRIVESKGGQHVNLVTDADKASEKAILEVLKALRPVDAVLAEESGAAGDASGHVWFIDPLDGTTNFAHEVPHYCTTVAVEGPAAGGARRLLAAVTWDPIRDECFTASLGGGAALNGKPIQVSQTAQLRRALMSTGFPYDLHENPEKPLALFVKIITQAQGLRRMGSAALDMAYVACGRYDGFFEFGLSPWDVAAGALLVTEAGGNITAIGGAPFTPRVKDLVCSGKALFAELSAQCEGFRR